ncbi:sortase domain-bontaining protein [Klenkia terrae]|uniref:sortase domain-containing protein n=1 Tax=Klenkia terrae TaxID=1052259 RepID=UPI0036095503
MDAPGSPAYQSPDKTATHIHEASVGQAGPPRIALPDPEDDGTGTLVSSGCRPFTTRLAPQGTDTGQGFTLDQIETNPSAFSTDTRTSAFAAGAVRGQLVESPVGGVETGAGGTAASTSSSTGRCARPHRAVYPGAGHRAGPRRARRGRRRHRRGAGGLRRRRLVHPGGRPGARGPTVLMGHVDSTAGPAVSYVLRDLAAGDTVDLTVADGSVATYTVTGTEQVAEDTFPTAAVFGATADDVLRLITCTGSFDAGARSYTDNLVVTAVRTG